MKTFEYKMLKVSDVEKHNELNRSKKATGPFDHFVMLGKEGWEYCGEYSKGNWLFKRENK